MHSTSRGRALLSNVHPQLGHQKRAAARTLAAATAPASTAAESGSEACNNLHGRGPAVVLIPLSTAVFSYGPREALPNFYPSRPIGGLATLECQVFWRMLRSQTELIIL